MCFDCLVGWRAKACFVLGYLVAKACAPRGWRFNEAAGAVHRLPCDARCRGYAAETYMDASRLASEFLKF